MADGKNGPDASMAEKQGAFARCRLLVKEFSRRMFGPSMRGQN